ncbi:hypothetical protein [Novosphingobium mangrovi (ex Hu et al. 2023)]|uniref:HTH psq-type domain-containing protein n=1 Tax=Novosphingobium mangrovi (ex Hu et al. 2023) TaxID=2930094 RepID=A0ABT0AFU3_9SPHN|nr:hypothetical protein [Novosphingobium mangrovi (ex Hu et al. 2023)]MCJ1962070.1 hypothetical protein [Novosphingobium mangrovi (ex Hu et al. 2023)]
MPNKNKADLGEWEGPASFEPDPEHVGPAMMAHHALSGALSGGQERAAETVAWAAKLIASQLQAPGMDDSNGLPSVAASVAIDDARMLLEMVAELFCDDAVLPDESAVFIYSAELKRARGRPARPQSGLEKLGWWYVAKEVEELIEQDGDLLKVAVGKVAKRLGLNDSTVAGWYRKRRAQIEQSPRRPRRERNSDN